MSFAVDAGLLRQVCERYSVARLEVFATVSRDEDEPDLPPMIDALDRLVRRV